MVVRERRSARRDHRRLSGPHSSMQAPGDEALQASTGHILLSNSPSNRRLPGRSPGLTITVQSFLLRLGPRWGLPRHGPCARGMQPPPRSLHAQGRAVAGGGTSGVLIGCTCHFFWGSPSNNRTARCASDRHALQPLHRACRHRPAELGSPEALERSGRGSRSTAVLLCDAPLHLPGRPDALKTNGICTR